jgi:hypothetical protein
MGTLATQISTQIGTAVPGLQVNGFFDALPTVPAIDVYPDEAEAGLPLSFRGVNELNLNVRARINALDRESQQQLLVKMMSSGPESVGRAIRHDRTLGGKCSSLAITSMTGFQLMQDAGGKEWYIGVVWSVRVVP